MANQLNHAIYNQLNSDISDFFKSGNFIGVQITVFSDAEATNVVTDANGPIQDRLIGSVIIVDANTDQTTGIVTNASISIKFSDDSLFLSTDNVDSYWYTLSGLAYAPRKFGSA